MTVAAGTGVGAGAGIGAGAGVGAVTGIGAAIAALERAGNGKALGKTAAFAPGKGTGANWPGAAKGSGAEAGSNESFKASWQLMLRAWGVVARASSGAADPAAGEAGETGAATKSNERQGVDSAQAALARAGADAVQSALTASRSNGPAVGVGAPANNTASATRPRSPANAASPVRLQVPANAASVAAGVEASAQSSAEVNEAKISESSTGAVPSAKSERRASAGKDAGAHPQAISAANGLMASPVDGAGLAAQEAAPVQMQITPANLADSLASRPAKQIDEPLSGASETEPEAAVAAIRAKGSPWTTAAAAATRSSTSAHALTRIPAGTPVSAAESTLRDEEMSEGAAVPIGDQEEFAALPQAPLTAPAIAATHVLQAASAIRQGASWASRSTKRRLKVSQRIAERTR